MNCYIKRILPKRLNFNEFYSELGILNIRNSTPWMASLRSSTPHKNVCRDNTKTIGIKRVPANKRGTNENEIRNRNTYIYIHTHIHACTCYIYIHYIYVQPYIDTYSLMSLYFVVSQINIKICFENCLSNINWWIQSYPVVTPTVMVGQKHFIERMCGNDKT